MPSEKPARRLQDIIDNAQTILRYTAGMDGAAFEKDRKTYDAVERCLERIDQLSAELGAFVTVTVDSARAAAVQATRRIADGKRLSPLDGVPTAIKDLALTEGVLTQLGSAPYAVSKHAALAFAEWLAITYGDAGLKVSVLAPQAVRTAMTAGVVDGGVAGVDGMLEPDQVADAVVEGLDAESFLILPHPEVREYFLRKASDYERWLNGMRRLQTRFGGAGEPT